MVGNRRYPCKSHTALPPRVATIHRLPWSATPSTIPYIAASLLYLNRRDKKVYLVNTFSAVFKIDVRGVYNLVKSVDIAFLTSCSYASQMYIAIVWTIWSKRVWSKFLSWIALRNSVIATAYFLFVISRCLPFIKSWYRVILLIAFEQVRTLYPFWCRLGG